MWKGLIPARFHLTLILQHVGKTDTLLSPFMDGELRFMAGELAQGHIVTK